MPAVIRDKFLSETLFRKLARARDLPKAWVTGYHTPRPHSAPATRPPRALPGICPAQSPDFLHAIKVQRGASAAELLR
ncbi:integrase core domain-containing protein [Paracoccus sp. Arc7-R13]|uniref:integrase core domain-containing protein n=1 Tax=Paracoccus TaxID=265 RepID=UPI000FDAD646|nr:hypothetical protein EOJ32_00135 [Paracoccus sp. Arc7-R13]TNC03812.1 transposase [Paracoccus marcusii]